jgi:hypothetical protein
MSSGLKAKSAQSIHEHTVLIDTRNEYAWVSLLRAGYKNAVATIEETRETQEGLPLKMDG